MRAPTKRANHPTTSSSVSSLQPSALHSSHRRLPEKGKAWERRPGSWALTTRSAIVCSSQPVPRFYLKSQMPNTTDFRIHSPCECSYCRRAPSQAEHPGPGSGGHPGQVPQHQEDQPQRRWVVVASHYTAGALARRHRRTVKQLIVKHSRKVLPLVARRWWHQNHSGRSVYLWLHQLWPPLPYHPSSQWSGEWSVRYVWDNDWWETI